MEIASGRCSVSRPMIVNFGIGYAFVLEFVDKHSEQEAGISDAVLVLGGVGALIIHTSLVPRYLLLDCCDAL